MAGTHVTVWHGVVELVLLVAVMLSWAGGAVAVAAPELQKLAVKKHLNRLNKPPMKSIQSPDGDIIDCVRVTDQPAFDHPLLKNHTIQMRPAYHPEGIFEESKKMTTSTSTEKRTKKSMVQLWHQNGRCPENTIPIRRTKEEDIFRASSFERFGRKKCKAIPRPMSADVIKGHEYAIAYVQGQKYYGTEATINIWTPEVQQPNEFSLSQLWIVGGSYNGNDLNTIEAGWQVFPQLYGDNNIRLFIYWTRDAYQTTGCYNLLCSGFVQTNNEIAIGGSINPVSQYGGSQREIDILVWKDPKEGNWWLQYQHVYVGYWPSCLFSYLADSASLIEWGGEVINSQSNGQHTSTQMGSGHFSDEWFGKASYFRNLQFVDESNTLRALKGIRTSATQSKCYNVQSGSSANWGNYLFYGGPGRNLNCP